MGAISDRDDALAWWCLSTLAEEVEKERLGQTSSLGNSTSPTDAVLEADKAGATTGLDGRSSTKPEQSSLSESTSSMPSVAELDASVANSASTFSSNATPPAPPASLLRQTHLQLVLIEQLSTINLVLFQSTLSYVRRYILAEEEGGATRNELVNKTFETISQGLDASKKEAGIRWWLDHRREFGV